MIWQLYIQNDGIMLVILNIKYIQVSNELNLQVTETGSIQDGRFVL